MQWIIHIGTPKTGSKALQRYLAAGRFGELIAYPRDCRAGLWHAPLNYRLPENNSSDVAAAVDFWAD